MRFLAVLLLTLPLALAGPATPGDTDGDGLKDVLEDVNSNGRMDGNETDRMNADTDRGGEADGAEVRAGRNPLLQVDDFTWDKDEDGLTNGEEFEMRTNPSRPDTDNDGIGDKEDPFPLDARYKTDLDKDGIPDEYERLHAQNPEVPDATEDPDADGLTNVEEFQAQTEPEIADTDLDGVTDGEEVAKETDPTAAPCLKLAPAAPTSFPDADGHWAMRHIELLHRTQTLQDEKPIVEGYLFGGARYFLPDREISRYELLKITLMSTCAPWNPEGMPVSRSFTDVSAIIPVDAAEDDRLRSRVIYTGLMRGIVEGYPEGDFRPDIVVNRAEAVAMLLRATGMQSDISEDPLPFSDIPEDAWYREILRTAVAGNIIEGYADRTFRAGDPITRAEAAKIVALLMEGNASVNANVNTSSVIQSP
ncbi:MAG: AAA ATPase [Candidatus Peregrinibacteria bacterium Greene0416_62]|nr:MAG: AAA ATPase [Candidatus Peregrinibacteria bacterium Greene0416_62]TSD00506.1 MAG: AAA ATPase [Candidatus Peregrinibacteria bacterium Greene1014_49]